MSNSKHTPGPWAVEEYPADGSIEVVGTDEWEGLTIAAVRGRPHKETTRANAATIAAAPELLRELIATRAALEAIEAHCVNERGLQGIDHADEGKRIRAAMQAILAAPSAITKATNS